MTHYYVHYGLIDQYCSSKKDAIECAEMFCKNGGFCLLRKERDNYAYLKYENGKIEKLNEGLIPDSRAYLY